MNLYDKSITANFRRINNITTIFKIIKTIEEKIGRTLLYNERASVRQMLDNTIQISRSYRRDPIGRFFIQNDENIIENISNKWILSYYV